MVLNCDLILSSGVKIMKDFVLSGYSCEDSGDLTGIEVTPSQGPVQTVQCGSLVTLHDKIIDRDTFGGLLKFSMLLSSNI